MAVRVGPFGWRLLAQARAGFYAAEALMKGKDLNVEVDLYDRLPTP